MKKVLILGASGSIGVNSLNVLSSLKENFSVTGLTVNKNISLLKKQSEEFNPSFIVVRDKASSLEFKNNFNGKAIVLSGDEGLVQAAAEADYDILINALVGFAGLAPTIEAAKRGKRIALANKETLVAGGEFISEICKKHNSEILPIDSEHSAIFQCLWGEKFSQVNKLILTASGGPFLNTAKDELNNVTVNEALNHPNWKMGSKITIDSASMMNKGLEVIEAHWLFGFPSSKIEVVVHPQSIIHSFVEFIDGSIKAQLGLPDMRLPIQYALTFPDRFANNFPKTDFTKISSLTFFEPDLDKFECLKLAYEALNEGGTASCILNAANEVAVERFLNGEIKFTQIPALIKSAIDKITNHKKPDLETIIQCDKFTRQFVANLK
jgi:1-deoxy-D-xylulose-5-phosphate reductoisomerase